MHLFEATVLPKFSYGKDATPRLYCAVHPEIVTQ